MTSTTTKLPSSLVSLAEGKEEAESLQSILARIYAERGHFRNITEESLKAEIANRNVDESSSESDEEVEVEAVEAQEVDTKTRREQLYAAKVEMVAHIASAQNEALTALDFVSLLLSKDAPKQAELTMSPYLKQHIKPGVLGMDTWQNMQPDLEQEKTDDMAAQGWRMQSLQESADSLLGAATRLEKVVKRETTYWEQVLSVSEKGWSVSRMPRERHNLGVRFGFLEAHGEFRDRGLAALRADSTGNVILAKGVGHNPRAIRVRLRRAGKVVGLSTIPRIPDDADTELETRIRHARDSLYEEELFHEITREARLLASYGVSTQGSTISMPTRIDGKTQLEDPNREKVLIDLISLGEDDQVTTDVPQSTEPAQAVALAFRLLLSYTHRERLRRRSEMPPPLTIAKKETPVAKILRPVLTYLQHRSTLDEITGYLKGLQTLLANAKIEAFVEASILDPSILDTANSVDDVAQQVTSPLNSRCSLSIRLPNRNESVDFQMFVITNLGPPLHGSRTTVESPIGIHRVEVQSTSELREHLNACIAGALVRGIADSQPGWRADERMAQLRSVSGGRRMAVMLKYMPEPDGKDNRSRLTLVAAGRKIEWTEDSANAEIGLWGVIEGLEEAKTSAGV